MTLTFEFYLLSEDSLIAFQQYFQNFNVPHEYFFCQGLSVGTNKMDSDLDLGVWYSFSKKINIVHYF